MGCKSILCSRSKRPQCTKSVSFCREEECAVFTADDYDRTPVEPSRDLSTRDYQELEEVLCESLRRERGRGQMSVGIVPLLPLLQDEPPTSPPLPAKFVSTPSRFTSFNFLPVNVEQQRSPAPPLPNGNASPPAPRRDFSGFAFMSVVPVNDGPPPPRPPPMPVSRPVNFLPAAPTMTRAMSPPPPPPPPSSPMAAFSCTFKRGQHPPQQQQQPQTSPRPTSPVVAPVSCTFKRAAAPQPQPVMVTRPSPSSPNGSPTSSSIRNQSPMRTIPPGCVPSGPGGANTSPPPPSLLRTLAS